MKLCINVYINKKHLICEEEEKVYKIVGIHEVKCVKNV